MKATIPEIDMIMNPAMTDSDVRLRVYHLSEFAIALSPGIHSPERAHWAQTIFPSFI
jgi:hypothetical protein